MKKSNLFLLIGATILLFAFTKKKKRSGSIEIGPLQGNQIIADAGAIMFDTPYKISILYNFKGGEWLTPIKDLGDDWLVEYTTPANITLRGAVAKTDLKIAR